MTQTIEQKMPNQELVKNYRAYTDKYFLRSKQILKVENINPTIRYQIFARKDMDYLEGLSETVGFVKSVVGDKVKIYSLKDGQNYQGGEPLMKLEGRVQDLVDLETVYLGIMSGRFTGEIDMQTVREKARAVVKAAKDKPVYYFGARHFLPELDKQIGKICYEEGFDGASTDIGAKAWSTEGIGTIPHALIIANAAYRYENGLKGNITVETAKIFDKHIDEKVPRILLIDTFNREIYDSVEAAKNVPNLKGVRIDTCGENYSQGSRKIELPELLKREIDEKYLTGSGVKINSVWALRRALDDEGFGNLEITVSSGFNEKKTEAFLRADGVYQKIYGKTLFDSIGTGSLANPVMATSDIVAYYSEKKKKWIPLSKNGRGEVESKRLEVAK